MRWSPHCKHHLLITLRLLDPIQAKRSCCSTDLLCPCLVAFVWQDSMASLYNLAGLLDPTCFSFLNSLYNETMSNIHVPKNVSTKQLLTNNVSMNYPILPSWRPPTNLLSCVPQLVHQLFLIPRHLRYSLDKSCRGPVPMGMWLM
jgi:hypothetical protein